MTPDLSRYPALARARAWSLPRLHDLRRLLQAADLPAGILVAASGSLGRLEAGPFSDADLIVVLPDAAPADVSLSPVWAAASACGLEPPQANGIYAVPVRPADLCDPATRGLLPERPNVYGSRLQLLLDARPVYDPVNGLADLLRGILARFRDPATAAVDGPWAYLLDELIRYHRSLRVLLRWDRSPGNGGPLLRDVKLRIGRLTMFAGLVLLLGEASALADAEGSAWLAERLALTPLERIGWVYAARGDAGFDTVAAIYDDFLNRTNQPAVRQVLAADWTEPLPEAYRELREEGRRLAAELQRFVAARRGQWDGRFVEGLLF